MLRLGAPAEAGWHDLLPGIRVNFAAITIKGVRAARRAVADALKVDPDDIEEAGDALSRELIRRGIREWEGVLNTSDDETAPITPETIEMFIADPVAYEAADRVYVRPWADREREKNGWSGSPSGISATPARATASGSATTAETADASPTPTVTPPKPAQDAPTSSSRKRRTRPRTSGRS